MTTTTWIVLGVSVLLVAVGFAAVWSLWRHAKAAAEAIEERARTQARKIIARAELDAEQRAKDGDIMAKERLLAARAEFERETRDHRVELVGLERKLEEDRHRLETLEGQLEDRRRQLDGDEEDVGARLAKVSAREEELDRLVDETAHRLEQVAGLTRDEAKEQLLATLESEARIDAAHVARRIEEETTEKAKEKARRIVALAVERVASEYVTESTVSVVDLPSDDMKGRVIGREGRNIRAFEQATGVDLIVDDTPEAVILSCFEPVRREVARRALVRLVQDGRIHPARIEEVVAKVQGEMEEKLSADGEAAALEMGIPDLHPELHRLLGRLQYRSSYGQNALKHSMEVAWIAAHMAAELGCDEKLTRRAGLVHDIGKAIDREVEGTHLELGRSLLKRYGEKPEVIHAMECHHGDYEPHSVEAVLITAADAVSAARPGARREILENYVKRLEELEGVADGMDGVDKAYAIQAGRELRIVVEADHVTDEKAFWLAKDVAKKIEAEMTYPGMIKVTVIRETRSVEYAR